MQVDMAAGTTAVWRPGFQRFAGEPKFVPRPGAAAEDDGWLLCVVFHSGGSRLGGGGRQPRPCGLRNARGPSLVHNRPHAWLAWLVGLVLGIHPMRLLRPSAGTGESQLAILDARDVEQGPVAVLQFRQARQAGAGGVGGARSSQQGCCDRSPGGMGAHLVRVPSTAG